MIAPCTPNAVITYHTFYPPTPFPMKRHEYEVGAVVMKLLKWYNDYDR